MGITSFLSSFVPAVYAEAPESDKEDKQEESTDDGEEKEGGEAEGGEEKEEEEEEDEPEDLQPALREECEQAGKCASLTKHFQHCQEKVEEGKGFKGEDCIEEFMMHCVDNCVAPKLFSKLR